VSGLLESTASLCIFPYMMIPNGRSPIYFHSLVIHLIIQAVNGSGC